MLKSVIPLVKDKVISDVSFPYLETDKETIITGYGTMLQGKS